MPQKVTLFTIQGRRQMRSHLLPERLRQFFLLFGAGIWVLKRKYQLNVGGDRHGKTYYV